MGYWSQELLQGIHKYTAIVFIIASWIIALIDMFTNLANGWWFVITAVLTGIGGLSFLISRYNRDRKKRQKIKQAEEEAAAFQPRREEEIREILKNNPQFTTLCYQCALFDQQVRECKLILEHEVHFPKVRDIKINGKSYCLYWQEN